MGLTIREKILQNLETTLGGITTEAGYNNTLAEVERWKHRGNPVKNVPKVVICASSEQMEPAPDPLYTCKFTVILDVWVRQAMDDATPTDQLLNSLLGDIIKALKVDITRGGNAENTEILSSIPFDPVDGEPSAGIGVELLITYSFLQSNPESLG